MGRECEMEWGAGFLIAVPQRSPTLTPWRATYSVWSVCAKRPTSETLYYWWIVLNKLSIIVDVVQQSITDWKTLTGHRENHNQSLMLFSGLRCDDSGSYFYLVPSIFLSTIRLSKHIIWNCVDLFQEQLNSKDFCPPVRMCSIKTSWPSVHFSHLVQLTPAIFCLAGF